LIRKYKEKNTSTRSSEDYCLLDVSSSSQLLINYKNLASFKKTGKLCQHPIYAHE
ncbi:hypothetical protein L9F63_007523, partial [Diploptera punctata]